MSDPMIEQLALTRRCEQQARAAKQYLHAHGLTAAVPALSACLASWVRIKIPEALRDAGAALDAGMGLAAEATFLATMAQAGIEAAREAGRPTHASVEAGDPA